MKLKIICGQLEITPGRPDVNYKKIIDAIEKARSLEADILLLPKWHCRVILSATFGSSRHFWMTAPIMPKRSSLPPKISALSSVALPPNQASSTRTDAYANTTPPLPAKTVSCSAVIRTQLLHQDIAAQLPRI